MDVTAVHQLHQLGVPEVWPLPGLHPRGCQDALHEPGSPRYVGGFAAHQPGPALCNWWLCPAALKNDTAAGFLIRPG
eukprot:9464988-Heterocapsa_arctica.AAC.1